MAVAHRASAAANGTTNTTSLTITIPASIQAGDILFVATVNRGATADPSVTDDDSGGNTWALVTGTNQNSASGDLWWKRATPGTASKTITVSGCTTSCSAVLSGFSGGKATDPPYENAAAEANASANETHAGFTPSVSDSMICLATIQVEEDNTVSTQACTDPGALTELIEHINNAGGGGGNHSGTAIAAAIQGTAAATGNLTWAQANNQTVSIGWNILPETSVTMTVDAAGAVGAAGQALAFLSDIAITTGGAVAIAGQDNSFFIAMLPDAGGISIDGQALAFTFTYALDPGAVSIDGQSIGLSVDPTGDAPRVTSAGLFIRRTGMRSAYWKGRANV